jgi:hypothetical protein
VDEADLGLRNATYGLLADLGRVPTAEEAARSTGLRLEDVRAGWRSLHEAHALVLDDSTGEIRMANPFAAVTTRFRVQANGRSWHANCAWDAFGICAALGTDGLIETTCPDCDEPIAVEVRDARPDDETLLFHCLVPADRWWENIDFT